VQITNPYFVPDGVMMEALLRARQRGVRVLVLLPGRIDWNVVRLVSRRAMGPRLAAGGEFYEYTTALLHAKSMVVDGVWATVGSTNLDGRSLGLNAELNAAIYDAEIAGQLDRIFMADLAEAQRLSYEQWRERPLRYRFLELLAWPLRHQL
jgi:cardiolipin synthase A/B